MQYERTRDQCIHGIGCKTGAECKSKALDALRMMLYCTYFSFFLHELIQFSLLFLLYLQLFLH